MGLVDPVGQLRPAWDILVCQVGLVVQEVLMDLVDLVELEVQVDQEVLHCQAHQVEVLAALVAAVEVSPVVLAAAVAMMVFQEWEHQDNQVDPRDLAD